MKKLISLLPVVFGLLIASPAWSGHKGHQKGCQDESLYKEIDRAELASLVEQKKAFVIDVNSKKSFKKEHVPGAIHYGSNEARFAEMLPKDKGTLIVAYCGGPMCGAWKKAAEHACELGYTQIRHFKAGIKGWVSGS